MQKSCSKRPHIWASVILLYSQTKGVQRKYLLCISVSVVDRQYIYISAAVYRISIGSRRWVNSSPLLLLWTLSLQRVSAAESSLHRSQSPPLTACGRLFPLPLLSGLAELQILWLPWVDSATNDSPYPSLNTALLASQPYPRRVRISRLAPVLKKSTQFLYQAWEP